MDQDHDFSALRNLLASTKLDMPQDTQVDEFLAEFHRRQRAQLLVPQSVLSRGFAWIKERISGFELVPSLSYGTAFAAIAIISCLSLSQQVQVTQVDGQSKLTFRMAGHDSSFAMVPAAFLPSSNLAPKTGSDTTNFTPIRTDSTATRYVLANNTSGAHDATVAF